MPDDSTPDGLRATLATALLALLLLASLVYTLLTRTGVLLWFVLVLGVGLGVGLLVLFYRLVVAVEEIAASI